MSDNGNPEDPTQVNPQRPNSPHHQTERVRRTHTPALIPLLQNLSLSGILKKNKAIEAANEERLMKTLNNADDPIQFPETGSETASLITIKSEDLNRLRIPTFFSTVKEFIYPTLAKWLADQEILEKSKRKADDRITLEEARINKRRCVDGSTLVDRVPGAPMPVQFADILFATENAEQVPLTYFTNRNLQIILVEASTIPQVRSNSNTEGQSKGPLILDKKKLAERFGAELSLTCSQWCEAAENHYHFQQQRDVDGDFGAHAEWFNKHFNYFNNLHKRDEMYEAWAPLELKLRQERYVLKEKVCLDRYDREYAICESSYLLEQKLTRQFGRNFRDNCNGAQGWGPTKPFSSTFRRPYPSQPSFPSGSGRPSLTSTCIVCAEKGHASHQHLDESSPAKFKDGKPTWARITSRGLVTPDNKPICINWNVRGDRGQACAHNTDIRLHRCSFCGSKNHHAFSWTCQANPANN